MDLIAEIIKRKEASTANAFEQVKALLHDYMVYEKLARHEAFGSLDHPITKAQCPHLVEAQDATTYTYYLWKQLTEILIPFVGNRPRRLLPEEITERDQILATSYSFDYLIYELRALPQVPDHYVAYEQKEEDQTKLLIIVPRKGRCDFYLGTITQTNDQMTVPYRPIKVQQGPHVCVLTSYSSKGNNDYPFGTIDGKPIRIREGNLLVGDKSYPLVLASLAFLKEEQKIAEYLLHVYCEQERMTAHERNKNPFRSAFSNGTRTSFTYPSETQKRPLYGGHAYRPNEHQRHHSTNHYSAT